MNPYTIELLARDRIATFNDEVRGRRTPRRRGGSSARISRLTARLSAARRWLRRADQPDTPLESTAGAEPGPA